MKVEFKGQTVFSTDIDFGQLKSYIGGELVESKLYEQVSNEMIYNAFLKNPIYYLIKIGCVNPYIDVYENKSVINMIIDKFFLYTMKNVGKCYYVLKCGEVLATYNDPDMAKLYAHRMDGYITEV